MLDFSGGPCRYSSARASSISRPRIEFPPSTRRPCSPKPVGSWPGHPICRSSIARRQRYSAKILRGAKPGDLPAKYPAKYFLTLNAAAAKKIGLDFPAGLLAEATRVLEQ